MDYSSYMETIIFRTAAMLGFRRLQSYMLSCLYALPVGSMTLKKGKEQDGMMLAKVKEQDGIMLSLQMCKVPSIPTSVA